MSFTNVCCFLAALIFFLSKPSTTLANRRNSTENADQLTNENSAPQRPRPQGSGVDTALCEGGPRVPILPPSFTQPGFLWSVRAMMLLQILPDGKINGTLEKNPHAKLDFEIVGNCLVRIKGTVSQRYLVMQSNGTLISQTQPDKKRSIFNIKQSKIFYAFENDNHFIALNHGGSRKKIKGDLLGRSRRRSTQFVVIERTSRKRRYPSGFNFKQSMDNSDSRKLFGDLRRR